MACWAGESSRHKLGWLVRRVYPRVGGGTPTNQNLQDNVYGLSPRGRGNRDGRRRGMRYVRSIPAWAGEPTKSSSPTPRTAARRRPSPASSPHLASP